MEHTAPVPDYVSNNPENVVFHNHLDYGHLVDFGSINQEREDLVQRTQVCSKKQRCLTCSHFQKKKTKKPKKPKH